MPCDCVESLELGYPALAFVTNPMHPFQHSTPKVIHYVVLDAVYMFYVAL